MTTRSCGRQLLRLSPVWQRRGRDGPDLTGIAGRFSRRDLLESIVDPNKVISDQYAAVRILMTDVQQVENNLGERKVMRL